MYTNVYFLNLELVPSLLAGLSDPNNKATTCLKLLLETEFVHVVDAPSLALIMPLLQRALQLRSTESKKIATQIIANIYCLTQPKVLYIIGYNYNDKKIKISKGK